MWSKLHPAVSRHWLYGIAGVVWTAVGTMLGARALGWLQPFETETRVLMVLGGSGLSIIAYLSLFRKIIGKNIRRISDLPDPVCVFAFTPWRGYLIILFMVTFGALLRSSPIPRPYLVIPYAAMGGVLILGSLRFYRELYSALHIRRTTA